MSATLRALPGPDPDARPAAGLTVGELRSLILACVAETRPTASPAEPGPALLTREQIAKALRVGPATIDRLRRDGLPHVRAGGAVKGSPRFRLVDVLTWLEARKGS